jgi:quinolinate synthase
LVDEVDLSLPIEIPAVPPEADPVNVPAEEHRVLLAEIARLKKRNERLHIAAQLRPSLRDGVHEITVDSELAARAGLPIERMLSIV